MPAQPAKSPKTPVTSPKVRRVSVPHAPASTTPPTPKRAPRAPRAQASTLTPAQPVKPRPARRSLKREREELLRERRALGKGFTPRELLDAMDLLHRLSGLPPATPEYEFALDIQRKWRCDRAWPEQRVALEIEGGVNKPGGGAHQRTGKGGRYLTDMEKYNELAARGWLLLRATYDMLPTPDLRRDCQVLPLLERALAGRAPEHGA